jgi:hypothetical protein
MKEKTKATVAPNRGRNAWMTTVILAGLVAGTIILLRASLPFSSQVKGGEADCTCIEVKENEDLNILQAMPFPLLPALEVAYSKHFDDSDEPRPNVPFGTGGHMLLCSTSTKNATSNYIN